MIIYNSRKNTPSSKNYFKSRNHIGFGGDNLKVKTSEKISCKVKKIKLTKKNIAFLKSLGLKVLIK